MSPSTLASSSSELMSVPHGALSYPTSKDLDAILPLGRGGTYTFKRSR